jgi:hypothetical protein
MSRIVVICRLLGFFFSALRAADWPSRQRHSLAYATFNDCSQPPGPLRLTAYRGAYRFPS